MTLGCLCIMEDLTRHVINDAYPNFAPMYKPNTDHELSAIGIMGQVLTWVGFALFLGSLFAAINLYEKMARTWRRARGQGPAASAV